MVQLHTIARGEGDPVVLLHGLFGSARNFGTVQKRLSLHWRVLAMDLRNHGESPHAPGMDYATLAEDVRETLVALNALPCALIGHSMGGKTAMRLALEHPHLISRLIVGDIAPVAYPPRHHAEIAAMLRLPLRPGLTRAEADKQLAASIEDPALRGFLLQNLRFNTVPYWRIGLAEIATSLSEIESWPPVPDASRYEGPTLFVIGGHSSYVQPSHRPLIRQLFPSARFVTIKRAGHWLHADDPETFLAVVEAFLAS